MTTSTLLLPAYRRAASPDRPSAALWLGLYLLLAGLLVVFGPAVLGLSFGLATLVAVPLLGVLATAVGAIVARQFTSR